MAIILAERDEKRRAGELLSRQIAEAPHQGHADFVRALARHLDIEVLE
jgi:hypothetical protein